MREGGKLLTKEFQESPSVIELNVGGRLRSRAWKLEPMEREVREGGREDTSR